MARPKYEGERVEELIEGCRRMGGYSPGCSTELIRVVRTCWEIMTTSQRVHALVLLEHLLLPLPMPKKKGGK